MFLPHRARLGAGPVQWAAFHAIFYIYRCSYVGYIPQKTSKLRTYPPPEERIAFTIFNEILSTYVCL